MRRKWIASSAAKIIPTKKSTPSNTTTELSYPQRQISTSPYKRDDATLVKWLKERDMADYIKVSERAPQVLGALKKEKSYAATRLVVANFSVVQI